MRIPSRVPKKTILAATALSVLLGGALLVAAQERSAPPDRHVDVKADEILRQMSRTLADAREFTFEAHDMIDHVIATGQKVQVSKDLKVAVRRPGMLAAEVIGDDQHMHYAFQGGQLTLVNHRDKRYAQHDAPETIDAMFDHMAARYGVTPPLADLVFSDPYTAMTERVRSGHYLGVHRVKGVKCHHLAFRQEGIDWQIWIEDSDTPRPRKLVITYKEMPGYPQFVALLDNWNLNPQLADSTFDLTPPADYQRVDLEPVSGAAQDNR